MNEGRMKLLYRAIIFVLLLVLAFITYFAGIPRVIQDYHYQRYRVGSESITPLIISKEDLAKHAALEKEWKDFYEQTKTSQDKTMKYKHFHKETEESQMEIKYIQNTTKNEEKTTKSTKKKKKKRKKNDQKIILIYTWLHKSRDWYNLPQKLTKNYLKRTKCKYQNCIVTYDKDYLHLSDVVIFHDRNTPSTGVLETMSVQQYRPKTQRWVYFTSETPLNSEFGTIPFNNYFNWTMTYKVDSDIFLPYFQFRRLGVNETRPDPSINYASIKTGRTVWLVGNCKFAFRMDFAHLLSQHTEVHVGGGCRDQFEKRPNCTRWCDLSYIKNYKFYLSFENGICTDYITEKYSRYLELGLVPVVLGGANYSDPRLAIPGSFIDASKFKSVKELGLYLNYLDKNDTAYNEYFKWKQTYKIWHPAEGDWPFESYFLCDICGKLNKDMPDKVYTKLSDFWNEYIDCEIPEKKLQKKFIPSGYSFESREKDAEEKRRTNAAKISRDFDEDFA